MHSKTSSARIIAVERRIQALDLRKSGATFRQIGSVLGCSEQRAHAIVTEELQKLRDECAESTRETLELEVMRLDRLLVANWRKAIRGNPASTGMCLRVMERRAKLLGLDAPEKRSIAFEGQGDVVEKAKYMTDDELEVVLEGYKREAEEREAAEDEVDWAALYGTVQERNANKEDDDGEQ